MAVRGVLVYNFRALVSFTLISIQTSFFLIALIPIAIIYIIVQTFYIATSRQVCIKIVFINFLIFLKKLL